VAKYKINDVIEGQVTKLVNFGAFVRVEEGLEGLIHISELSNQRVAHPGDVVKEGETLKLKIISLDSERHRLGLSLKQADDRAPAAVGPGAGAPQPRYEDRPRRDRRDRRDRDYRPEDAVREPDEGIDNTMAAAFAESGLLDQFRASQKGGVKADASETAAAEEPAPAEEPAADEAPAAEAPAAEEAPAEEAPAEEAPAPEEASAPEPAAEVASEPAEAEAPAEEPAAVEAEVTEATEESEDAEETKA
jgi:predicted RNA-binding protein with RPS1 domain